MENFFRMKEVEQVYMLTDEKLNQEELTKEENLLVECLVTNQSELVGQSLKEANFRRRLAVLSWQLGEREIFYARK